MQWFTCIRKLSKWDLLSGTYCIGELGLNVCKNENTVPRTQSFAQLSTPGDPFSISVEGQGEVQEPPGDTVIGFDAAKAVTTGDSLGRPRPSSVLVRVDGRVRGALLRQPQMRERRPQGVRLCNVSDEKTWRCLRQVQSIFCAPTINIKIVLQCFIQPCNAPETVYRVAIWPRKRPILYAKLPYKQYCL